MHIRAASILTSFADTWLSHQILVSHYPSPVSVGERFERGQETMEKLEEDPPKDLADWPTDEAKYTTFGGGEGDHSYEEGPEKKLGPSGLRHNEDGSGWVPQGC